MCILINEIWLLEQPQYRVCFGDFDVKMFLLTIAIACLDNGFVVAAKFRFEAFFLNFCISFLASWYQKERKYCSHPSFICFLAFRDIIRAGEWILLTLFICVAVCQRALARGSVWLPHLLSLKLQWMMSAARARQPTVQNGMAGVKRVWLLLLVAILIATLL